MDLLPVFRGRVQIEYALERGNDLQLIEDLEGELCFQPQADDVQIVLFAGIVVPLPFRAELGGPTKTIGDVPDRVRIQVEVPIVGVPRFVVELQEVAGVEVRRERVARLAQQVRRITQRVNLFEKVLIPRAKKNIKRIQIGLGEQERSAVVTSKIAKKKRLV